DEKVEIKIEEIKIEEPVSQSEPIPQPTELSFFEWLNYANKNEIKIEAPEFSSVIEEEKEEPVSVPQSEPQSNVSQFDNILDKFIRENPSISRPKSTFYSPVNMAKQSVAEDEEFV